MKKLGLMLMVLCALLIIGVQQTQAEWYQPTWESLRLYNHVPEWLREGKFGIYTHWGPYAVHAFGENTTWYSNAMYGNPESEAREHFEKKFGKLTPEFGYKDLIPKFTAEKFDAEEWAELFSKSGARFAGPVAEHHDGFAMWDTKYSDWNAAKMGPKRDVVGELEKAIKGKHMKFVVAFHHAANWFFFPVWDKQYDTGDPKYSGLYGQPHEEGAMRNQAFIDEWYGKIIEVIDNYEPDFIWFDFALDSIPEGYVKDFLAYYYNHALIRGKDVVVTYKGHDLVPGTGVRDLELGQEAQITYNEWITDSTVDDRGAWGYAEDLIFKSPNRVIDNLVDRVSKNGYLLLNVGPKPDGTIPEEAQKLLLEVGEWLDINGDAIYGTTPWTIAAEGPTNLGSVSDIGFNESNVVYTSKDIRFTVKGDNLYATFLAWPGDYAVIQTLRGTGDQAEEFEIPRAAAGPVDPELSVEGKTFTVERRGRETIYEFKDDGKVTITSPPRREGGEPRIREAEYEQDGMEVTIKIGDYEMQAIYNGENFMLTRRPPRYEGFYKEEIKRVSMLGDGKDLEWHRTNEGLVVKTPSKKPCEHAYVIKIERYHHPKIN